MTKDEVSRRLRKVFNEHAQSIEPSQHALFSINRRIKDADEPRQLGKWLILNRLRPSIIIGSVGMLAIGLFAGYLITNNSNSPGTQVQLAAPDTGQNSGSRQGSADISLDNSQNLPVDTTDQSPCNSASGSDPGNINVYFTCDDSLVAIPRSSTQPSLENALQLLIAGPTQDEIQNGLSSAFVDASEDLIKSVEVLNSWAVVDFSSDFPASANTLSQLNSTVFDFSEILLVEYRIENSCEAFGRLIGNGKCSSYTKAGARPGGGDRIVVPLKQAQTGQKIIYSCASSSNCSSLGTLTDNNGDALRIHRYTGGQHTNEEGTWLELITLDNKLGWVKGNGVSVQMNAEASSQELYPIVNLLSVLPESSFSSSGVAFSSAGIYGSYVSTAPYGYFYISDPHNPTPAELDNLNRILEIIRNTSPAELIEPSPLLQNIKYVTVESSSAKINIYFDYRNEIPEIIAISIHYEA